MHHIGIATVDLKQQIAVRTDTETQFGINGRIRRSMRLDDTGMNQPIPVFLHVFLQRTESVTTLHIRIEREPVLGDLCLQEQMRRRTKRDILGR